MKGGLSSIMVRPAFEASAWAGPEKGAEQEAKVGKKSFLYVPAT